MLNQLTRWDNWWLGGCLVIAAVGVRLDDAALMVTPFIVGIVGALILRQVQDRFETHPCPRCGDRLEIGETVCECGHAFEQPSTLETRRSR